MAEIKLKGNVIHTNGDLPSIGTAAPDFKLTGTDLSDVSLADYKGNKLVLNIFPSLDTSVCATSVRKFNVEAASLENAKVLCISKDLPFAHERFCSSEGIKNVINLSDLRPESSFAEDYGILITDGPLNGVIARAVVVADENGKVIYSELVPEITQEPDYEKALKALS